MRTRYRQGPVSKGDNAAAVATSLALGAGVAVVSFYVMRLFLGREVLSPALRSTSEPDASVLPAEGESSGESAD